MAPEAKFNAPPVADDVSQPMRSFGCESSELKRLEETSRLMQQLEWQLARRSSRPRKESSDRGD
jgi:hypothetical protein